MRINEKRLRQLIREAIKKEPLFDPVVKSELDDAMLRSRVTAITKKIQKDDPSQTEKQARELAEKLIDLYDSDNEASMTQAEVLTDTLGVDPAMLDMKYYQGDRDKFLGGQLGHAKSVAADQLRANLTDPNANFGNPQIGNPDLASDETQASKWWKENVLNKPAVLADLEVIPFKGDANYYGDGIIVASSDKKVIKNLIKNMLAHRRVGDSADYIEMRNRRSFDGMGQTRKLGNLHGVLEYGTADPFQAYRLVGDSGHHTSKIKDMIRGGSYEVTPSGVDIGKKFFVVMRYDHSMAHAPMAYSAITPYASQTGDAPRGPFHGYQSKTAGAPPKRKYDERH